MKYLSEVNGSKVWLSTKEFNTIETLKATRHGGCASVHEYIPTSNWDESPVQNIQFLSRVSTANLYKRRYNALQALTFGDVAQHIANDPTLSTTAIGTLQTLFDKRKAEELSSIEKTQSGDRSDAHRQGHDRCYIPVSQGVKIHLETVKNSEGIMEPVLLGGYPVAASIMISALFLNVKTIKQGVRHVTKSGASVLMKNIIAKVLNSPGMNLKMLSLKEDNFTQVVIDGESIVPQELFDLVSEAA